MALATTPSLYADDMVALGQNPKLDRLQDAPFEAAIHVLLPICVFEIRLAIRKQEWIYPTVEVTILLRWLAFAAE